MTKDLERMISVWKQNIFDRHFTTYFIDSLIEELESKNENEGGA